LKVLHSVIDNVVKCSHLTLTMATRGLMTTKIGFDKKYCIMQRNETAVLVTL